MGNFDPCSIALLRTVFYFLRHGETESNRLKTIAGSLDVELNETGRAQAREAIGRLRPLGITHIASSGLRRARETAALVAAALDIPHVIVPGLAERGWGSLEGRPRSERARNSPPPDAEPYDQFARRVAAALAAVDARGVPLVVAHSSTFRVLCRLLDLEEPGEQISNCSPVRFAPPPRTGERWTLEVL